MYATSSGWSASARGELSRLLPAGVVQRRIGVALVPAVPVPVGLSVADDDELVTADTG